ncbi:GrpB family protein [Jannaschia pohangensis]|uniref:GrpB domain, predicted nucleotidyltransferase, UPF0157 family n=1 Tax=Jannaschia pohangensis TaxID=390807 RepID=A0A1I3GGF3_9RHOB|nr:GrpB family protein [Jannaschia pohangensis]SFI22517.1 GrpB domain, predicted nucleotidyltransferase, UPF0157 family [Jannaschia pohangensis]
MSEALGLRQGTLDLVPHDPFWAALFAAEVAAIRAVLPPGRVAIDHIGSTAVPGLAAKPILDIGMLASPIQQEAIAAALVGIGYIDRGERSGRLFIRLRDGDIRTHNLHLYAPNDPAFARQIAFRDMLRADAGLRDAYADLKRQIIRDTDGRRAGYAEAKGPFIEAALSLRSRDDD